MKHLIIVLMSVFLITGCGEPMTAGGFDAPPTTTVPSNDLLIKEITAIQPIVITKTEEGAIDLSILPATSESVGVVKPGVGLQTLEDGTLDVIFGSSSGMIAQGNDPRFGNATSINGMPISSSSPLLNQVMTWDGSTWGPKTLSIPGAPDATRLLPAYDEDSHGHYVRLSNSGLPEYRSPAQLISDLGLNSFATQSVPTCGAGKVLSTSGGSLSCVDLPVVWNLPTCAANQVVASNGSALSCVALPSSMSLPTCTAGKVVTSNGTTLSCTDLPVQASIPTCSASEVLTSTDGVNFSCRHVNSASSSGVTSVTAGTGLLGGTITSTGTLSVNVGTGPNQIVQLSPLGKLPVLDGSALTNVSATNVTGLNALATTTLPICTGSQTLSWNGSALACVTPPSIGFTPVNRAGDMMTGNLDMDVNSITNLGAPISLGDATNKNYVDSHLAGVPLSVSTANYGDIISWSGPILGWTLQAAPTTTIPDIGTSGTYTKVTTDSKGRVTSGGVLSAGDIPDLDAAKITSGVFPTSRIPGLAASHITTGVFDIARIPSIDFTKILAPNCTATQALSKTAVGFSCIEIPSPMISASGDLAGSYPNPSVVKIQGVPVSHVAPVTGQAMVYDGTQWMAKVQAGALSSFAKVTSGTSTTAIAGTAYTIATAANHTVTLACGAPVGYTVSIRNAISARGAYLTIAPCSGENFEFSGNIHLNKMGASVVIARTDHSDEWAIISSNDVGTVTCQSGMTRIGFAGATQTFCVDSLAQTAAEYFVAAEACSARGANLCSGREWNQACNAGGTLATNMLLAGHEWVIDSHDQNGTTMGRGGVCTGRDGKPLKDPFSYRCCSK